MKRIQKIAYDPRRIKRPFFSALERLMGAPHLVTGKLFENDLTDGIDYLNLTHAPWKLPWDAKKPFTTSFPKMMECAAEETARIADAVFRFLTGGEKAATFAVLRSRRLDTSLDWRENPKFTAVACVYAYGSRTK